MIQSNRVTFDIMQPIPELAEQRLYDLLELTGQQVIASARLLLEASEEGVFDTATLAKVGRTSAKAVEEIRTHLLRADVVSLPKAEVDALIGVLAAIPLDVARLAEWLAVASNEVAGFDLRPALTWIEELSEVLSDMVRQLRGFESLDRLKELHARLLKLADHAEAQVDEIVTRRYKSPTTALHMLVSKDLSQQLSAIIERYREAGKVLAKISFEFF